MKELRAHAGFPIAPAYGPEDLAGVDFERDIGRPGDFDLFHGRETSKPRNAVF